jgi:hypothetical protein
MTILLLTLTMLYSEAFGAQTVATPKAECETLMNAALPFAEKMLKEHGEFFPYGAALKATGKLLVLRDMTAASNPRQLTSYVCSNKRFLKEPKPANTKPQRWFMT